MSYSHRFAFDKYSNFNNLRHRPTGMPGVVENLCMEVYNKGTETMTFHTTHAEWRRMNFFGLGPFFWKVMQCKPGEWIFLPHSQYDMLVPSGNKLYPVVMNLGDAMFKGNKLPSRPEAAKVRSFVPG